MKRSNPGTGPSPEAVPQKAQLPSILGKGVLDSPSQPAKHTLCATSGTLGAHRAQGSVERKLPVGGEKTREGEANTGITPHHLINTHQPGREGTVSTCCGQRLSKAPRRPQVAHSLILLPHSLAKLWPARSYLLPSLECELCTQ